MDVRYLKVILQLPLFLQSCETKSGTESLGLRLALGCMAPGYARLCRRHQLNQAKGEGDQARHIVCEIEQDFVGIHFFFSYVEKKLSGNVMHRRIVVSMKQGGQKRPGGTWLDWPSSDSRGRRQQGKRKQKEKVCA